MIHLFISLDKFLIELKSDQQFEFETFMMVFSISSTDLILDVWLHRHI